MKLTIEQIKGIIKEELSRILYEEEREITLDDLNLSENDDYIYMYGMLWNVFEKPESFESDKQYIELAASLTGVDIDLYELTKKGMVVMYRDEIMYSVKWDIVPDRKVINTYKPALDKLENWDGSMKNYKDFVESLTSINKQILDRLKDDESEENMTLRIKSERLYQNQIANKRLLNYIFMQSMVDDKRNYEAAWEKAEKVTQIPIVFQAYHTLKEEVEKAFGSEPAELKAIFSFDDEN